MSPLLGVVENIPLSLEPRNSAIARFTCKEALYIARMRIARLRALRVIGSWHPSYCAIARYRVNASRAIEILLLAGISYLSRYCAGR